MKKRRMFMLLSMAVYAVTRVALVAITFFGCSAAGIAGFREVSIIGGAGMSTFRYLFTRLIKDTVLGKSLFYVGILSLILFFIMLLMRSRKVDLMK